MAESFDEAVKLAYRPDNSRWRVVTTKGQLIDTSGTMSGGGASLARVACCWTAKLLLPLLTVNKKMKSRRKIYPPREGLC